MPFVDDVTFLLEFVDIHHWTVDDLVIDVADMVHGSLTFALL